MKGRSALGLVCAALLVAAPGADAATVAIQETFARETVFVAAPGESNNVVLTAERPTSGGFVLTVSDSGAALTPGNLCQAISAHVVQCRDFGSFFVRVDLGDMDDELNVPSGADSPLLTVSKIVANGGPGRDRLVDRTNQALGQSELRGGPGRDRLVSGTDQAGQAVLRGGPDDDVIDTRGVVGTSGVNLLDGGPGNDRLLGGVGGEELHGGGGADELRGGDGDDTLTDDDVDGAVDDRSPGPDTVNGGGGVDAVSYRGRTAPVNIDLADAATDGRPGEGDRLRNVESVIGGRSGDRLAGNGRANLLDGRGGRDRLIGRGGADDLRRAEGRVDCGGQRDRVVWHLGFDAFLAPDCELLTPADPFGLTHELFAGVTAHPTAASVTSLRFRVWCPHEFDDEFEEEVTVACEGPLSVRERIGERRTLATGDLPFGAWYGRRLTARLTPLGRRLASRARGVRARVRLTGYFRDGALSWTIRLKVPR